MREKTTTFAAIIATDAPLLKVRSAILGLLTQEQPPQLIVVFLTGQKDFSDALVRDLPSDQLLIRCSQSVKRSAEAYTFALRLAYAESIDCFACIDVHALYRTDYFSAIRNLPSIDGSSMDASPACVNLINQEWLPLGSHAPSPFHFRDGLGLSEEERKAGQKVGAPGTFVLNRSCAKAVLADAEAHPRYQEGSYDQVWRQALLSKGINITLAATDRPVYCLVEQSIKASVDAPDTEAVAFLPTGLRMPAGAAPSRLRVAATSASGPEVSVVVPTYNEGNWLFHTIDSLHRMRTERSMEILVIDDGCTDGSIESMRLFPDVRVIPTPHKQAGLIAAKNTGAASARGRYLCFIDSHMLVRDYWLDSIVSAVNAAGPTAFCTCNITDVAHYGTETPLVRDQYGYTLADWAFNVRWHHYGRDRFIAPYRVPLCPGGMSLMRRDRFMYLGGFAKSLRKWGSEDVELSLRNYCAGGETISEPRTHIYHYFKNATSRKRTFTISFLQTAFNALFVARTYMSTEDYRKTRAALLEKTHLESAIEEIESGQFDSEIMKIRSLLKRTFKAWREEFSIELREFEAAAPAAQLPQATGTG